MARTLLDSLYITESNGFTHAPLNFQEAEAAVVSLATDIHTFFGNYMDMATTMFPQKAFPLKRADLPQHLWPKKARHDTSTIRRRTKTLRRLVILVPFSPDRALGDSSPLISLCHRVHSPLRLRTELPPPPKDLDSLGLLHREDLEINLESFQLKF